MKPKIKKILVALDYDPTAQKVAEEGFSLARAVNAQLLLLHVISELTYYSTDEHITIMGFAGYQDVIAIQNNNDGLIEESQNFLEKTKQHLGDDSIQTAVEEGDVAESILKIAGEQHVDIIVMGSHSRRWLEKIIMGSVTEKVLNQTSIPMFIVPTKKQVKS